MKKGDEITLEITGISTEGYGIGRIENYVIFAEKSLPGDTVLIKIKKKKSNYAIGNLISIVKPSKDRIEPECRYFGVCGGCKLQNYNYIKQLEGKEKSVRDAFQKIGGMDSSETEYFPILKSREELRYRNKTEFSFSTDKWYNIPPEERNQEFTLGFHVPGFFTKIVDIEECLLQSENADKILKVTRDFFGKKNTTIYNTKSDSGFLRFLVIRKSSNTDDCLVNLVTYEFDDNLLGEYTSVIQRECPFVTSVVNSTTKRKAQVAFGEDMKIYYGSGTIIEKVNNGTRDLAFKISPNSFFQTNTRQAENLYKSGISMLELNNNDNLLDLYCGAGSISLFTADAVKKVTGVELVSDSIMNAKENAELNDITNCEFIESDIRDFIKDRCGNLEYNKLILDPPRAGLHPDIAKILSETVFEKILYISCNPSTQARDIATICSKEKYIVKKIQPVDMFPQTYHVENICLLEKK